MTVTDLGASVRTTLPPCTFAVIGLRATVFGDSNVFTLSTFDAVNVSPAAIFGVMPANDASISAGSLGSRFVIASQTVPLVSLAAIASTRGSAMSPAEYVPASNFTGTKVASWNGTYILKT